MELTKKIQSILNHNSINKNRVFEIESLIKEEIKENTEEKNKTIKIMKSHNKNLIITVVILLGAILFFILVGYFNMIINSIF